MEKEKKSQRAETDFVLQWGSKKKLRCLKVNKGRNPPNKSLTKTKLSSLFSRTDKLSAPRLAKKSPVASMEKEDRYGTARGSHGLDNNGKISMDKCKGEKGLMWPKLVLSLSSKEKEEDFMVMKGCKPSQRPKKRAKPIQKTILLVSPGAWLSDVCQERYEVREKKSSKKAPRGLKAMGNLDSDTE